MKIVISSVLKPVHDTRLFQKIAQSLYRYFPDIQIHILAHQAKANANSTDQKDILQESLFHFSRLHPKRILANWLFFRRILTIRPKVLIVTTFELLPAALIYKLLYKTVLIYDVQENYYKNITYTKVFPPVIKNILAWLVRSIERVVHPFVDHYLLAEDCYWDEMPFMQSKSMIIRNKFSRKQLPKHLPKKKGFNFLYSGTISRDYGILEAILFLQNFREVCPEAQLKIIGYCPQKSFFKEIKSIAERFDYISLEGGADPVPHEKIIDAMQYSDYLLMPYELNQSVVNRIPTKMYEALALKTPMIIQENPFWQQFLGKFPFQSAIWIDYYNFSQIEKVLNQLKNTHFYKGIDTVEGIYWEEEAEGLRVLLERYF